MPTDQLNSGCDLLETWRVDGGVDSRSTIELGRAPAESLRYERGGDWIAFRDLDDGECLWVMSNNPTAHQSR